MNLTFLKQIIRNLVRRKFYTSINLLGLGIGLGCVILMASYVIHEFSFDKYHSNSADIYRVIDGDDCKTYYAMGEAFKNEIPEIKNICRLMEMDELLVKSGHDFIEEDKIVFSDPSFLEVFDLEIINGSTHDLLTTKDELILSERIARKYFPNSNPIGELMSLAVGQRILDLRVSAVYRNFPSNSSLQTDFICNIDYAFSFLWDLGYALGLEDEDPERDYRQVWERDDFTTFIQLHSNTNPVSVQTKCIQICSQHREENPEEGIVLQSLSKMYLHSNHLENTEPFLINQLASLKIFMGVGLLILLVAILNFILISNADNRLSLNEIACRKVNGASQKQIVFNELFKSVFIAFISLIPAFVFVRIMIPVFNNLFQKKLSINLFLEFHYIVILIGVTLLAGLSSGLYLGLYVSKVNPASIFQKNIHNTTNRSFFKGALIVIQLIVFVLLSSCFMLMMKQYNYTLNKDLGLNSENIIAIDINRDDIKAKVEYLKNEIQSHPDVIDCKPTSFTVPPSDNYLNFGYRDQETGPQTIEALIFGEGVIELLQIPLVEGRSFNSIDVDGGKKFILNRAAAKKHNLGVGDKLANSPIIGIVENFHYHSLHSPVGPVLIALQAQNYSYLLIKTNGRNSDIIEFTRQLCHSISPSYFLEYELLDDRIAEFYEKEEKQMGTIGFFSTIALVLSIMGLLGFVSLNLLSRTKEIGVRKINGATSFGLIMMMNIQYVRWIFIALLIACPLSWYAIKKWLENFAYKTELSWWIFALVGVITLAIVLLTVSLQSWRAAKKNPVEALRYE